MQTYYVGVDLGTSRTSVATSTGARKTEVTCIGFPKDVVSSKRLEGREFLIGKEALENRLALRMDWPLENGVLKEAKNTADNTELILKSVLLEALPDIGKEDKVYAAVGVPAQASIDNKQSLIKMASNILDKVLIVSEPFAVAYGMDRFDECLVVDVGAGCLAGDTQISLLDGSEVQIKDLEGKRDFYVYSYDFSTGKIVPGRVSSCTKTRLDTKLVEVELDNGAKVRCTPDHPFLTRNGRYTEAQYLKAGDSLMPLYRRVKDGKYEELLHPSGEWQPTHRMVYLWKYGKALYKSAKWIAHHKDTNGRNNTPSLLIIAWFTNTTHQQFCKEKATGKLRKIYKFTKKDMKKSLKARQQLVNCPFCEKQFKRGGIVSHMKACEKQAYKKMADNHKVVAVRFLTEKEDTYDLTVEQHHNFALTAGIFVHNTVDCCRIHGSLPEEDDQITLKTAGNYLDKEIEKAILEQYPGVQLTSNIIQRIKEKYGYVETSRQIQVTLTKGGIPGKYNITGLLKESCLKMTDPICKAVQKLVADFDPDFQEKIRNNVIVAGGGSRLKGIDSAIENGLQKYGGGDVICVQDPEFGGAVGALKMALEMPDEYWEEID